MLLLLVINYVIAHIIEPTLLTSQSKPCVLQCVTPGGEGTLARGVEEVRVASRHVSVRLVPDMVDRLDEQSRHAGQTRTQLTKTLLEEGLRMEAHPGIVFRSGPAGRRPGLAGGQDIWEIARLFRSLDTSGAPTLQAIADELSLSMHQVRVALNYYVDYRDEVDQWIDELDREADQALAAFERQQALLRA